MEKQNYSILLLQSYSSNACIIFANGKLERKTY